MLIFSHAFHLHVTPSIWEPAKQAKVQFTVIYGIINNNKTLLQCTSVT